MATINGNGKTVPQRITAVSRFGVMIDGNGNIIGIRKINVSVHQDDAAVISGGLIKAENNGCLITSQEVARLKMQIARLRDRGVDIVMNDESLLSQLGATPVALGFQPR